MIYSLGFAFISLPSIFTSEQEFTNLDSFQKTKIADKCLFTIILISSFVLIIFNSLRQNKFEMITFRGLKWFFSSVINSVLIMAHFPVALMNYVIFWPLIHNSVGIRDKKTKEWFLSSIFFIIWSLLSVALLFGTFLFHHTSEKQLTLNKKTLYDQVLLNILEAKSKIFCNMLSDYIYAGSNLWVYFCTIVIPNLLFIIQV